MPKPRRPQVVCPWCNAKGIDQPVLSEMKISFVAGGTSVPNKQPFNEPHLLFKCPRCQFCEIHDSEDK